MVTFRSNNNNNRRPPFRSNNEGSKFSNNDNFRRGAPGRNNHNAPKLIEKYTEMAREALANEDRVLSENYFQHADHFTRVQNEQESIRMARVNSSPVEAVNPIKTVEGANPIKIEVETANEEVNTVKTKEVKKIIPKPDIKKIIKTGEKKPAEKKLVAS